MIDNTEDPCASGTVGCMSTPSSLARGVLAIEGALNVRDLGGLPTEDGGTTLSGRLIRSDSPHALTDAGIEALSALGLRTVVDLRTSAERLNRRSRLEGVEGISVVACPIFTDDDPDPDPPLLVTADIYARWLDEHGDRVGAALSAIAEAANPPVLVHCHRGKDRTGLIVALVLRIAGVPADVVADDYARSGEGLRDKLEKERRVRVERGENPALVDRLVTVTRESMIDTLEHLDREHGGAARFARSVGLDQSAVRRLRDLLRAED